MVHFNPINFNKKDIASDVSVPSVEKDGGGSIWAIFYDSDGFVDINDVKYSSSDVVCASIQNLLNEHIGGEYSKNSKLSDKINELIKEFNDSNNVKIEQEYNEEEGMGKCIFQGVGKEYYFSKEEIVNAAPRLGRDEPDYVLSVLGYEKLKEENNKYIDNGKIYDYIKAILPPDIECHAEAGVFFPFTINALRDDMKEHDYVIVVGTHEETVEDEWSDEKNKEKHFLPTHAYAVKDITETSVIVIEPNSCTENEYTLEEFYQKFSQIAYAKLN